MIVGSLVQTERWEALHPDFKRVFEWLKTMDWSTVGIGKLVLEEEKIWMNVEEGVGRSAEVAFLEAHDRFIDIQFPLVQAETFGWQIRSKLTQTLGGGYDASKDIVFYADRPTFYFTLPVGCFAVFFPEDAHAPCIGEGKAKKAVVKIRV